MTKTVVVCLLLCSLTLSGLGQTVTSQLRFGQRKMKVGQPVELTLVVRRPAGLSVTVKDSARRFAPFELIQKLPATSGARTDTFRYQVVSFEIDSVQGLSLHYAYNFGSSLRQDSTARATILFEPVVSAYTPLTPLQNQPGYAPVPDYGGVGWQVWLFIALGLAGLGYWLGREPFRRWLERRRALREWREAMAQLEQLKSRAANAEAYILQLNALWKTHLDKVLDRERLKPAALTLRGLTPAELQQFLTHIRNQPAGNSPVFDAAVFVALSSAEETLCFARQTVPAAELENLHRRLTEQLEAIFQQTLQSKKKRQKR